MGNNNTTTRVRNNNDLTDTYMERLRWKKD